MGPYKILVAGGAGYIGSITCLELLQRNFLITIIDYFSYSSAESLHRLENISDQKNIFL